MINFQVWSWGCNDERALGHEGPEFSVGQVEGLPGDIVQVAAGDSISAALTAGGRVWTWGTFRDSKGVMGHGSQEDGNVIQARPVQCGELSPHRITQLAAGANHLLALSEGGEVYAWGCGEQGQLGRRVLERHKRLGLRPVNVTPRQGRLKVRVVAIAAGSYHSLLLDSDHRLWAMGLNNYGQLGLGDHEDRLTAELLSTLTEPVVAMGAGEHHSLVLLQSGQLLGMGRADSGQLGLQPGLTPSQKAAFASPVLVSFPCQLSMIAVGGNHNLALHAPNRLYSWGYGEMHQLGHGVDEDQIEPRAIEQFNVPAVLQLAAGGQHSLVLTQ